MPDLADIIGSSGFNYSQRWGSKRGQRGSWAAGSRPPNKGDWDQMSQEERDAVGIPDEAAWNAAQKPWLARHDPGGDVANENVRAAEAISRSGATDFAGVRNALLGAGFTEEQDGNLALFKQLAMLMAGQSDPTGRYHRSGDQWVDVSTSDLSKRGIPGAADYTGPQLFGMDALRTGGSPVASGLRSFDVFRDWNRGAGVGGGKGAPGAGLTPLGNGMYRAIHGQLVDDLGFVYDPATGKRKGHYVPGGPADLAYGGGGMTTAPAPVDWTGGMAPGAVPPSQYNQFNPAPQQAAALRRPRNIVAPIGMASTSDFSTGQKEAPLFGPLTPPVVSGPLNNAPMRPLDPRRKIRGSIGTRRQTGYSLPALGA